MQEGPFSSVRQGWVRLWPWILRPPVFRVRVCIHGWRLRRFLAIDCTFERQTLRAALGRMRHCRLVKVRPVRLRMAQCFPSPPWRPAAVFAVRAVPDHQQWPVRPRFIGSLSGSPGRGYVIGGSAARASGVYKLLYILLVIHT